MLIYASSCPDYFAAHGEAFVTSAKRNGHRVKVDMVADFPEWRSRLRVNKDRTFNCFLRYMRLPEMLDTDDVLMLDIDSIINEPIRIDDCDMALFFRRWVPDHRDDLKTLMTASYWTKAAKPFAERVREIILGQVNQWGRDQAAVWQVYNEIGHRFRIKELTQDFVCYHFDRDAPIWTCKGPDRKNDPVYLERRAQYA